MVSYFYYSFNDDFFLLLHSFNMNNVCKCTSVEVQVLAFSIKTGCVKNYYVIVNKYKVNVLSTVVFLILVMLTQFSA